MQSFGGGFEDGTAAGKDGGSGARRAWFHWRGCPKDHTELGFGVKGASSQLLLIITMIRATTGTSSQHCLEWWEKDGQHLPTGTMLAPLPGSNESSSQPCTPRL